MGAGHASTSIGYAVGLAQGMRSLGHVEPGKVVAVIGDGAMTGGVAFEAIHQGGGMGTPMVVVLNDNGMSIAPNVGALSRYFNRVRLNPRLWHTRENVEERLSELPGIGRKVERFGPQMKESIKAFWAPGLFWEELGWAYTGVIDGHECAALRIALRKRACRERRSSCTIATVKGKGFAAPSRAARGQERGTPQAQFDRHGAPARRRCSADRPARAAPLYRRLGNAWSPSAGATLVVALTPDEPNGLTPPKAMPSANRVGSRAAGDLFAAGCPGGRQRSRRLLAFLQREFEQSSTEVACNRSTSSSPWTAQGGSRRRPKHHASRHAYMELQNMTLMAPRDGRGSAHSTRAHADGRSPCATAR